MIQLLATCIVHDIAFAPYVASMYVIMCNIVMELEFGEGPIYSQYHP